MLTVTSFSEKSLHLFMFERIVSAARKRAYVRFSSDINDTFTKESNMNRCKLFPEKKVTFNMKHNVYSIVTNELSKVK